MKLLLTSGGITNPSIRTALEEMLGKPVEQCAALMIPTAMRPTCATGCASPGWPSAPDDRTLGVVDFSIFPHLDLFPTNTLADAERWAAEIGGPAYAIDEQTAIAVVDGTVEVVSEGRCVSFAT